MFCFLYKQTIKALAVALGGVILLLGLSFLLHSDLFGTPWLIHSTLILLVLFGYIFVLQYKSFEKQRRQDQKLAQEKMLREVSYGLFDNVLEADITENKIMGKNALKLASRLGLDGNDNYDEIIAAIAAQMVRKDFSDEYKQRFSRKIIIDLCNKNESGFQYEFIERSNGINYEWVNVSVCIYRDFDTGTIRVISHVKNIQQEKEREFAILNKNEKLFELATRDGLTNIYNRAYFVDSFKNKLEEFRRTMQPFSLILLDIDYFKNINDEYGHLKGDEVLKEFSGILKMNIRKSDVLCRWGGEEFIILLTNTDGETAVILAEKIRSYIEQYSFKEMKSITASFGVIQCQTDDAEDRIFKRLDNSLYLAKVSGRNKVVSNEMLEMVASEKPMLIEWGPFFKSGNLQLDKDHHKLIDMSNAIIYNAFKKEKQEELFNLFFDLSKELMEHFVREEKILEEFAVDIYIEHQQIHQDLVAKTLNLLERFQRGEIESMLVAEYLIKDAIVGHLIKNDFDFFYIFRGSQT